MRIQNTLHVLEAQQKVSCNSATRGGKDSEEMRDKAAHPLGDASARNIQSNIFHVENGEDRNKANIGFITTKSQSTTRCDNNHDINLHKSHDKSRKQNESLDNYRDSSMCQKNDEYFHNKRPIRRVSDLLPQLISSGTRQEHRKYKYSGFNAKPPIPPVIVKRKLRDICWKKSNQHNSGRSDMLVADAIGGERRHHRQCMSDSEVVHDEVVQSLRGLPDLARREKLPTVRKRFTFPVYDNYNYCSEFFREQTPLALSRSNSSSRDERSVNGLLRDNSSFVRKVESKNEGKLHLDQAQPEVSPYSVDHYDDGVERLVRETRRWLTDILLEYSTEMFEYLRERDLVTSRLGLELGRCETIEATCGCIIDFMTSAEQVGLLSAAATTSTVAKNEAPEVMTMKGAFSGEAEVEGGKDTKPASNFYGDGLSSTLAENVRLSTTRNLIASKPTSMDDIACTKATFHIESDCLISERNCKVNEKKQLASFSITRDFIRALQSTYVNEQPLSTSIHSVSTHVTNYFPLDDIELCLDVVDAILDLAQTVRDLTRKRHLSSLSFSEKTIIGTDAVDRQVISGRSEISFTSEIFIPEDKMKFKNYRECNYFISSCDAGGSGLATPPTSPVNKFSEDSVQSLMPVRSYSTDFKLCSLSRNKFYECVASDRSQSPCSCRPVSPPSASSPTPTDRANCLNDAEEYTSDDTPNTGASRMRHFKTCSTNQSTGSLDMQASSGSYCHRFPGPRTFDTCSISAIARMREKRRSRVVSLMSSRPMPTFAVTLKDSHYDNNHVVVDGDIVENGCGNGAEEAAIADQLVSTSKTSEATNPDRRKDAVKHGAGSYITSEEVKGTIEEGRADGQNAGTMSRKEKKADIFDFLTKVIERHHLISHVTLVRARSLMTAQQMERVSARLMGCTGSSISRLSEGDKREKCRSGSGGGMIYSGLISLDLRMNQLMDDTQVFETLCTGLRHSTNLRALNVSSTGLKGRGATLLLRSLASGCAQRSLEEIDISFNELGDEGCTEVAEALVESSSCFIGECEGGTKLQKLRMRNNSISALGIARLGRAVRRNSRLHFLDVSSNPFGNEGVRQFSESLLFNRSLTELTMDSCNIQSDGCLHVGRALATNNIIKTLSLNMNPIGDIGLFHICNGLKYNRVIQVLSLNACSIGNEGFCRLLTAITGCYALKLIKVCYNFIGSPTSNQSGQTDDQCRRRWSSVSIEPTSFNVSTARAHHRLPLTTKPDENLTTTQPGMTIADLYALMCHVLQWKPDLKIVLWGNNLNEMVLLDNNHNGQEK